MAYNLYQVQMAAAWAERIGKEEAALEKFWLQQSLKGGSGGSSPRPGTGHRIDPPVATPYHGEAGLDTRSQAGSVGPRSAAPSGYTSKTSYLKNRMEKLEADLVAERECRRKVEEDLVQLRQSLKR